MPLGGGSKIGKWVSDVPTRLERLGFQLKQGIAGWLGLMQLSAFVYLIQKKWWLEKMME